MDTKDRIEKVTHDIESSLAQVEFAFHQKQKSQKDAEELTTIFAAAVQRIRQSYSTLKQITDGSADGKSN